MGYGEPVRTYINLPYLLGQRSDPWGISNGCASPLAFHILKLFFALPLLTFTAHHLECEHWWFMTPLDRLSMFLGNICLFFFLVMLKLWRIDKQGLDLSKTFIFCYSCQVLKMPLDLATWSSAGAKLSKLSMTNLHKQLSDYRFDCHKGSSKGTMNATWWFASGWKRTHLLVADFWKRGIAGSICTCSKRAIPSTVSNMWHLASMRGGTM